MSRSRTLACGLLLALCMAACLAAGPATGAHRPRDAIEAAQPHAIALLERLAKTAR